MTTSETATAAPARTTTAYELLGGEAGLRKLVAAFYRTMDTAPEAAGIGPDLESDRPPGSRTSADRAAPSTT